MGTVTNVNISHLFSKSRLCSPKKDILFDNNTPFITSDIGEMHANAMILIACNSSLPVLVLIVFIIQQTCMQEKYFSHRDSNKELLVKNKFY